MPLLGFPISQPCSCFFNHLAEFRPETHSRNRLLVGNDGGLGFASSFCWKTFCITKKTRKCFDLARVDAWRGGVMIRAVATLEVTSVTGKSEGVKGHNNVIRMDIESMRTKPPAFEVKSSSEDSDEVNEKEKLRRMRISKANTGNTPWNKGRKHSPETLQRIKERTRLAMQDPKVKMKLAKLGHAQSEETRIKIGMGVRLGWEKRREKLMLQETCLFEWRNLISAAARSGLAGEEELQWDSYATLSEKLQLEWLQSIEERKSMPRPKGSRRAPKSAEQRKKISEAISAKWADPEYRTRVCSALAKFHGTAERSARKPRIKPSGDRPARKRSTKKDEISNLAKHGTNGNAQRVRLKRARGQSYKDPLSSTKLEMIKNIRAQRSAAVNKRSEAVFRAKLLISEAEMATAALETAAESSPHVQASLVESRMLIAEAIHFIESIENEESVSLEHASLLSDNSTESPHDEEKVSPSDQTLEVVKVNGFHSLPSRDPKVEDFETVSSAFPDLINGYASNGCRNDLPIQTQLHQINHAELAKENGLELRLENSEATEKGAKKMKKWVRGKLVESGEET